MSIKRNRIAQTEERNKLIEQMDMQEIRKYLCMKNYQNPDKCKDCQGLKNCKAGQRVMVLMNEQEMKNAAEQAKADVPNKKSIRTIEQIRLESRKRFEEAVKQPDMVVWLMQQDNISRTAARNKLKYWAEQNRDIAETHDFDNWFVGSRQRKISLSTPRVKHEEAVRKYQETVKQPDPIAFIMTEYGQTRKQALKNWGNWKMRYGNEVQKDDDISVEDFLNENTVTEEAAEPVEEKQDSKPDFYSELEAKFQKISKEKEEVLQQIEKLKQRFDWLVKAQDALAMTVNLFNPESAIGKDIG